MYKCINILLLVLFVNIAQAQKHEVNNFLKNLSTDSDLRSATVSLKVLNTETKETLIEHNSNVSMVPASIQKVITTGLAFMELGKDFQFETKLAYSGEIKDSTLYGNLYIIGGGDPSLASSDMENPNVTKQAVFSKFIQSVKQKGINKIDGKVIADASYFSYDSKHPTWEWEDIGTYYGTGVSGLNFEENYFSIYAGTTEKRGDSIVITTKSALDSTINVENKITLVHPDSTSNLALYSSPFHPEKYVLAGNLPKSGHQVKLDCAMQSPSENCATSFTTSLKNSNIQVNGSSYKKTTVNELVVHKSPKLPEITTYANFVSSNLFADVLAKQIAKKGNQSDNFKDLQKTLMRTIHKYGLNERGVRMVDGSGLSRHNYVTADFMCNFLMQINETHPDFIYNLAVPGESKSTLRNFMNTYKNKGNFNLKSGSMTGVLSYTGYVTNAKGERLCVALIINNFTAKAKDVRKKVEKLMSYIPNI